MSEAVYIIVSTGSGVFAFNKLYTETYLFSCMQITNANSETFQDVPDASNRTKELWDHPWTTNEMREKRTDWNLAADSGLRQHLEQFSDRCFSQKSMTIVTKTQEAMDFNLSELDETILFNDNITNISLSLASKQFIESRVHKNDIVTESQKKQPKVSELLNAELPTSMEKNFVKRGIAIMDGRYETIEVFDSESEDEEEIPNPIVILRSKDRYRNRLLPYVIGSEKWKTSNKIGLESSSSESEDQKEDETEIEFGDEVTPISEPNNLKPKNS